MRGSAHKCVCFWDICALFFGVLFLGHLCAFLGRPWVFSRALGCGARRGPACTPRRKFGSRAGSVARAPGVQSQDIWQVIAALLSLELEPSKTMENPLVSFFFFFWQATPEHQIQALPVLAAITINTRVWILLCIQMCTVYVLRVRGPRLSICVLEPHISACWLFLLCRLLLLLLYVSTYHVSYHTVPQALELSTFGRHGTTTVAHQVLPFVMATDGAWVLRVCVLCFIWEPKHNLKRGWQVEGRYEGGAGWYKPTLSSEFYKQPPRL